MNKKLLAGVTSLLLLVGTANGFTSRANVQEAVNPANQSYTYSENLSNQLGGPVDTVIANEDKVIQMLKNEGKIAKNATYEEAQKIYLKYMQDVTKNNEKMQPSKLDRELAAKQNQRVQKYQFDKSKTDKNPKKVNILVLLVDYQDYKYTDIQSGETDMYYPNDSEGNSGYTNQHYQDMLFGDNGYRGPNGENLISMKQYYAQQSGGSLDIEGTVAGWYTLPKDAAYYGAATDSSNDIRPRTAVAQALQLAAQDPNLNLADFDKEDPYDIDGDGNLNEPDGIIDYLMVLHAGVGEEAGGGRLGSDAIWSHSWNLGYGYNTENGFYNIPGTNYYAYNYTIEPEDGATGVFAHEFGHNLGLPDEYDTIYSSAAGEPISYWSIMSSGSWGGTIPGAEPTGFSPYAKQMFQALYGGNWQKQVTINYNDLSKAGARVTLQQADATGQAVRINLPDRAHVITTPTSGQYAYWGGKGQDGAPILTNMTTNVDLTGKTSAALNFKTWYDIEEGWDFASVQVREQATDEWAAIPGNITTTDGVEGRDVVVANGITGTSDGWVDASFDLSAYAGKKIELKFEYETDAYTFGAGFYVDDIQVSADNSTILSDDVEGTTTFALNGFEKSTGTVNAPNYYLVEWRNQHGVDTGLAHISVLGQNVSYDPGMVIWYVDEYFSDNWTGVHPGEGYLGIIDADQHSVLWDFADGKTAPTLATGKYQMHDAAFSMKKEAAITVNTDAELGRSPVDNYRFTEPKFNDKVNYKDAEIPELGRDIPKLGLSIEIANQAKDNSSATIIIKK